MADRYWYWSPKTVINDARLAPTLKPEVEICENRINELAVFDFPFDFHTIYGHICHRLAVKNYFRFRENGVSEKCGMGRGLFPYQVASSSIQMFGKK